jgi:two-component system phosphate regulon sensor histidine kinase PhoR
MLRPSLFWKIFGASLLLIALTVLGASLVASRQVSADIHRETRTTLGVQVDLLLETFGRDFPTAYDPALQERVRALGTQTGMRVTLLGPDGAVLADSAKDPRGMDNHAGRPEIGAARRAGSGFAERRSDTLGRRMIYVARAVPGPDGPRGFVRGALSTHLFARRAAGLRRTILITALLAIVVGLLGAFLLARRLAGPLRRLADAASDLAGGHLHRRVPRATRDEVGDVGRAFNEMARRLEEEMGAIRRDRRELRAILGGMIEGVLAVDAEERIVLMNDAAGRILAVDEARASGHKVWESVRVPPITAALADAVATCAPQTVLVHLPGEGMDRIVKLHASPLLDDAGAARGAVVVLDDVTERERVETIRRDFVANASHELKTPIASVRGLVETILGDREMPMTTRDGFLERVLRQVGRLAELVEEMLVLSRLDAPGARVARRPLDLRTPVHEAVEDAQPLASERGIDVRPEMPAAVVSAMAEHESVRRIVGNLLDNAIKYTPRGGRVRVSVQRAGDEVGLVVADTGPGIPPEKHDRVFERFYRLDEGRSRESGGTGLGLAIVKHLVQALGGRIELESAPGKGTTFRIWLRAA